MNVSIDPNSLNRIEETLRFIENNIDQPLSVEALAHQSNWSRWQFQRVFSSMTGLTVAHYIRQLRLSRAAELLVTSQQRHLDIALNCGFESEVSFNRAFRQMFKCTPGEYRKIGKLDRIRTPIQPALRHNHESFNTRQLIQIRIENRASFKVIGLKEEISGIFTDQPDFMEKVPALWKQLAQWSKHHKVRCDDAIGVIDTRNVSIENHHFPYWATIPFDEELLNKDESNTLSILEIPSQDYAIIPILGPSEEISAKTRWVIEHWLPNSNYQYSKGFDIEMYEPGYTSKGNSSYMEYWLPIAATQRN